LIFYVVNCQFFLVGTAEQLTDAAVQRQWLPLLLDAARELRPLL